MDNQPYHSGERVELHLPDGPRTVVIGTVISTSAQDPHRRWRLLCRDEADGSSIDLPVYCGDDGNGDLLRAGERTTAEHGAAAS